LYVILPKPIRRYEFLLGKYFGIVLTVFVFIAIMGTVQLLVTTFQVGGAGLLLAALLGLPALLGAAMYWARDRTAVLLPWSGFALATASAVAAHSGIELWPILASLLLTLGEVLVLSAVALLFSAFSTPFLTALFTTGVWAVGRSADLMIQMKGQVLPQLVRDLLKKLVHVWPNFNLFVPGPHTLAPAADGAATAGSYVTASMGYAVLYSALLLTLAALIFRRRDFL